LQSERVELPAFDGEPMTTRSPLYIEMKVFDRTCYMTEDDFRIVSGLSGHRTSGNRKSFAELSEDAVIVRVVWQSKESFGIEMKARLKRRKPSKRFLEYTANPHVEES
jgi:hypothetical protein